MNERQSGNAEKINDNAKRANRLISTVSSHMVNHPVGLQAARPERIRQSLLGACPACRARSGV